MTAATVDVALGARGYEVRVGKGLIARAGAEIAPLLARPRVAIVTDAAVAGLHLPALEAALAGAGIASTALALPPGEATKGWAGLSRTVEWLLEARVERRDIVLALGGGVIGDLAGFAAAILRRGVRYVQLPTTLLAQVDSSVGGKTGINTAQGKNLVGAFHQPALVLADTGVLDTLPARDLRAGYGEVVKYGLLGDAGYFAWLERHGAALLAGDAALRAEAVRRSVAMKAAIVARDETETGERALLNLGHTFGHALETADAYGGLLHGEAVAIGMVLAARLSTRLGMAPATDGERLAALLARLRLPVGLPAGSDPAQLLDLMRLDKKNLSGRLRLILWQGMGRALLVPEVDEAAVLAVLRKDAADSPHPAG